MTDHTSEPWRIGKNVGVVVADYPVPEINGSDDIEYYGGNLIAESCTPDNAKRIVLCVNALKDISSETIEKYWTNGGLIPCVEIHERAQSLTELLRDLALIFSKALSDDADIMMNPHWQKVMSVVAHAGLADCNRRMLSMLEGVD